MAEIIPAFNIVAAFDSKKVKLLHCTKDLALGQVMDKAFTEMDGDPVQE